MTQIPKKPLAVSRAKRKLPMELDWGPGVPKDRLRYINAKEEALIKKHRVSKAARDYAGVKAYPDIGDTKAGGSTGLKDGASTRGADGPSGVGRGSGGGGSSPSSSASKSTSGSTSASSTSGGGSKSSSTSSAATSTPSRAPNAAAQAASNKLSASQTSAKTPATNYSASGTISRAPNAAAQAASNKLNATASALKTGQQPQSIQGMINSQGPVSYSGQYDNGYYHSFTDKLPGQSNPNQFDKTIGRTNMVNANHVPMDTFSNNYDPNKLTAGAQKIHQAITDNAFRTGTPVDFFSGMSPRSSGTKQHPAGQAIDVRLKDPVTGSFVGTTQIGSLAANPIGNVRPAAGRTPSVAKAIQGAIEGPYRSFATGVMNSFMANPGVYGDFNNQRWGGAFGGTWGKDYMHYDEGKAQSGVNADQEALRKEAMNYNGPPAGGTQFASNAGSPVQSAFIGGSPSTPSSTSLAAAEPSAPRPQAIPSPISTGMLGNTPKRTPLAPPTIPNASTIVSGDPRVSMPPGSYPSAPRMQSQVVTDPRVGMTLPNGLPTGPQRLAATSTGPSTYSPVSAPEDVPAVYSDNPMQGSQNPMQEGENPQVKKDRQMKYANTGATIGGVIAGPIGTVVGATLGWQMGKTPPGQRQAIANNPQALNANVQSINTMVEERGGKGNPQMRVTDKGLKDVLQDPAKVSAEPEKYTTLEQMLAALAQGIDPETGKPIT